MMLIENNFIPNEYAIDIGDLFYDLETKEHFIVCSRPSYALVNFSGNSIYGGYENVVQLAEVLRGAINRGEFIHYPKSKFKLTLEKIDK